MPSPTLVIFDCDGVLIDSEVLAQRVEVACLTAHGFPVTQEEVAARYLGISGAAMFADLAARFGRPVPEPVIEELRARTAAACAAELTAMPGIHDLLDGLALRSCVASSSRPERLAHTLGLTNLHHRFAPHVFSATMVANGKPAPDLFLHAAKAMGAAPAECIVVEDSLPGVQAGIAAGMTVFGFAGGGHCPPDHGERLAVAGAHRVFADMAGLGRALTPGRRAGDDGAAP